MKQVVSFSGGRTSAYLCSVLLDKFDRDDLCFVFLDTGAEHPKTYDFIRKVDAHYGLGLVCLRCDADQPRGVGQGVAPYVVSISGIGQDLVPFRSLCAKYGTPSSRTPFCTRDLKENIYTKWCNAEFGRGQWVSWLGIRADEPRRLSRVGDSPLRRYMAEVDDADKRDVLDFWREMPFDLGIKEHLGNCVFCVKKSSAKLALAARDEPLMAAEWEAMIDTARLNPRGERTFAYRGSKTFSQVLAEYADVPTEALRGRIRSFRNDANTCSESCEVFMSDPRQLDMFQTVAEAKG